MQQQGIKQRHKAWAFGFATGMHRNYMRSLLNECQICLLCILTAAQESPSRDTGRLQLNGAEYVGRTQCFRLNAQRQGQNGLATRARHAIKQPITTPDTSLSAVTSSSSAVIAVAYGLRVVCLWYNNASHVPALSHGSSTLPPLLTVDMTASTRSAARLRGT